MAKAYLCMVLHAHLPYVRHPEHEDFLEERWFYEAMSETYIPILRMLEKLERDEVDYRLVIGLSPTLVTMFEDALLQERYANHLRKLIALADREIERTLDDPDLHPLAKWYADHFRDILYWYEERFARRLAPAFARIASSGRLEIMTCGATHGFLPLLQTNAGAVRAQVHTAVEHHASVFGAAPNGMWVPECAYYPGLEEILAEAGIRYFFVDRHGIEHASAKPVNGVYAPLLTPNGLAVFGRDPDTSHQVWSAEMGYPGHPEYREFYRDVGYDLDEELLTDLLVDGHIRVHTGIKYCRITQRGSDRKEPWDPDKAFQQACEHAGNFLFNRTRQADDLAGRLERPPLVVSPYDAELFGHWWFEGPWFLDILFRRLHFDQDEILPVTPLEYLELFPENQEATPAGSSWGGDGTYDYWLNPSNHDIYRDLHRVADRLTAVVDGNDARPGTLAYRALRQMTRELMLAQASDWPFIMRSGTSPEYATRRIRFHLARYSALEEMLARSDVDEVKLSAIEYADRIFPDVRPEWYATDATRRPTPAGAHSSPA